MAKSGASVSQERMKAMFNKVKEECGVYGIYTREPKEELIGQVCVGLSALQHRGEESCGVAINEDGILHFHKEIGRASCRERVSA